MITIPTVFILGAGASQPYDFPVGSALKREIIRCLGHKKGNQVKQLVGAGASGGEISTFAEDLSRSGQLSVDAFLEHRCDLLNVGKMAIAQALIPKEKTSRLFMEYYPSPGQDDPSTRDWYVYLWKQMSTAFNRLAANAVSFITFNYDRSLEHFLATAIYSTHKNTHTREKCNRAAAEFSIVHVHGSLGRLPCQHGDGKPREYSPVVTPVAIQKAADSIQIVSEADAKTPEFKRARVLIREAKRVIFLGFGYHEGNLQKLDMPDVLDEGETYGGSGRKLVMGSACGLEFGELQQVDSWFRGMMKHLGKTDADARLFLRRNAHLVF